MQVDRQLVTAAARSGQAVVNAMFVDVAGDRDQVGKHGVAYSGGHLGVGQSIQTDVDDAAFTDDLHPVEDWPRVI
ncbi:hypothetical protein D3C87_2094020 [compost metagenome]